MTTFQGTVIELMAKFGSKENFRIKEYQDLKDTDTFYFSKIKENLDEYNERLNYKIFIIGVKLQGGVSDTNDALFLTAIEDFDNDLWSTGNGNIPESYFDYKNQREHNSMSTKDGMYTTIVRTLDIQLAIMELEKYFKEKLDSITILEENI
jgi:hypothetical protein